jgi:hypothetical protein
VGPTADAPTPLSSPLTRAHGGPVLCSRYHTRAPLYLACTYRIAELLQHPVRESDPVNVTPVSFTVCECSRSSWRKLSSCDDKTSSGSFNWPSKGWSSCTWKIGCCTWNARGKRLAARATSGWCGPVTGALARELDALGRSLAHCVGTVRTLSPPIERLGARFFYTHLQVHWSTHALYISPGNLKCISSKSASTQTRTHAHARAHTYKITPKIIQSGPYIYI